MDNERRILPYIFYNIVLLLSAVWIGGYGSLYICVFSLVAGSLMLIAGIIQLNKIDYIAYGSILIFLSDASASNYMNDIHDPVLFIRKYLNLRLKITPHIDNHRSLLTALVLVGIIICIIHIQGAVGKMLLLWDFFLSFVISMIGYLCTHDRLISLFLFALTMLFMAFHSILSIRRSAPYGSGIHILTLVDMPCFTVHYINGHDITFHKYKSEEWKKQPVETKKIFIKQEVKQFAGILSPGKYLIETHEAMIHLLKNNFSKNVEITKSKKIPALVNSKANSEFKIIYGKDWKTIAGKRKLYIWYFELSTKKHKNTL